MTETMLISFSDKTMINTYSIKKLSDDKKDACKVFGASGIETEMFVIKNSDRWKADPYGESAQKC